MGIAELTQSHKWKTLMKYVYGWGAAIVLVGALFKLTHWPGATIMLTVGLLVEAAIFFLSAFEPLHEEVDWTLVYPELAGLETGVEVSRGRGKNNVVSSGAEVEAISKFNEMLDKAGKNNLFEKFGTSMNALNDKVAKMSDISDATLATSEYTKNMKSASKSVKEFADKYKETSETIASSVDSVNYSVESLSDSFNKMNEKVSASGNEFVSAYKKLTNSMEVDFSGLENGSNEYNEHIGKLNKNLSALNAIFELQLNEADLDKMMKDLQGSVTHSAKYHTQISALGQKLEKLNNVYGNILAALNVKDA